MPATLEVSNLNAAGGSFARASSAYLGDELANVALSSGARRIKSALPTCNAPNPVIRNGEAGANNVIPITSTPNYIYGIEVDNSGNRASGLWRSTDGLTWTEIDAAFPALAGSEQIWGLADGTLIRALKSSGGSNNYNMLISRSTDNGLTWSSTILTFGTRDATCDRWSLAQSPGGTIIIAEYAANLSFTNSGAPVWDAVSKSTVTATAASFHADMVGWEIFYAANNHRYIITDYISTTQIKVAGNASGESGSGAGQVFRLGTKLYRSANSGASFTEVHDCLTARPGLTRHLHGGCYHVGADRWIWAVGDSLNNGNASRLMKSDDDGVTWSEMTTPLEIEAQPTWLLDYGHPTRVLAGSDRYDHVAQIDIDSSSPTFKRSWQVHTYDTRVNNSGGSKSQTFLMNYSGGFLFAFQNDPVSNSEANTLVRKKASVIAISKDGDNWVTWCRCPSEGTYDPTTIAQYGAIFAGKFHAALGMSDASDTTSSAPSRQRHLVCDAPKMDTIDAILLEPPASNTLAAADSQGNDITTSGAGRVFSNLSAGATIAQATSGGYADANAVRVQGVSPAVYTTGTVTVTPGSTTVTLAGGTWPTWAADGVLIIGGRAASVASRTDGTTIVLQTGFEGTGGSGISYSLNLRQVLITRHARGYNASPGSFEWKAGDYIQLRFRVKGRAGSISGKWYDPQGNSITDTPLTIMQLNSDTRWQEYVTEPILAKSSYDYSSNPWMRFILTITPQDPLGTPNLDVYMDAFQVTKVPSTSWQIGGTQRVAETLEYSQTVSPDWTHLFRIRSLLAAWDLATHLTKLYIATYVKDASNFATAYFDPIKRVFGLQVTDGGVAGAAQETPQTNTYNTGTVTCTNGSATVTLASGTFPTWVPNNTFVAEGKQYYVKARGSGTSITLDRNYEGAGGSGLAYALYQTPIYFHRNMPMAFIVRRTSTGLKLSVLTGQATVHCAAVNDSVASPLTGALIVRAGDINGANLLPQFRHDDYLYSGKYFADGEIETEVSRASFATGAANISTGEEAPYGGTPTRELYESSEDVTKAFNQGFTITPGANPFAQPCRGLYVGGDGNISAQFAGDSGTVDLVGLKGGQWYPYRLTKITAATATGLVGLL